MDQGPNQKADAPEAQPEPQNITEPTGNRLSSGLLLLLAVLVIYVLSIGPVARFFPRPFLDTLYAPLFTLSAHCPPFHRFLNWYVFDLWRYNKW